MSSLTSSRKLPEDGYEIFGKHDTSKAKDAHAAAQNNDSKTDTENNSKNKSLTAMEIDDDDVENENNNGGVKKDQSQKKQKTAMKTYKVTFAAAVASKRLAGTIGTSGTSGGSNAILLDDTTDVDVEMKPAVGGLLEEGKLCSSGGKENKMAQQQLEREQLQKFQQQQGYQQQLQDLLHLVFYLVLLL